MRKAAGDFGVFLVFAATVLGLGFAFFSLAFADEIRYDSGNRRDPFVPLVGPGGSVIVKFNPGDLNIEGIIFDPKGSGSLVLVNGEFYKEGQTVNKATIMSIFKDRVILRQDDEEKVLWIRDEVVGSGGVNPPKATAQNSAAAGNQKKQG
jgi:hypothetical protein